MKHIKSVNELFGIGDRLRSKFNKDEGVAKEILLMIKSSLYIEEDKDDKIHTFKFSIDGFNIKSERETIRSGGVGESKVNEEGTHSITTIVYSLYIDDRKLKSSDYINKKIWKKLESIIESQSPISDFRKSYRTR